MNQATGTILIAGLGNELLSDDGIGVHACRRIAAEARWTRRRDLVIAEVGTAVCDALHLLEQASRILAIDAMQAGGKPGTLYLTGPDGLDQRSLVGLHQLDLLGALGLVEAEASGRGGEPWRPPRVEILGVEPTRLSLGMTLSAPVAACLPQLTALAWQRIGRWAAE